jgi:hypothetical protein
MYNLTLINDEGEAYPFGEAYDSWVIGDKESAAWHIDDQPTNESPFTGAVIHRGSEIVKVIAIGEIFIPNEKADLELSWSK